MSETVDVAEDRDRQVADVPGPCAQERDAAGSGESGGELRLPDHDMTAESQPYERTRGVR